MVTRRGRRRRTAPLPLAAEWERWGVDSNWSRFVDVCGHDGVRRRWHVLERVPASKPIGTIVCVHGNPTWSFLWRSFLAQMGDRYRVIAVDQLGMGFSDRCGPRRYADRVKDLDDVISALDISGSIILAGHDWGGAMVMGWAVAHPERTERLVLCNTGIAIPKGTRGPNIIRLASAMTCFIGHHTRTFVDGTLALSRGRVSSAAREGYRAPYRRARSRHAVGEFVADAPFNDRHPSAAALSAVAESVRSLTCPVLLVYGAKDPVFSDAFADDLAERMPQAQRHRFALAGHLVIEEQDVAAMVDRWLAAGSSVDSGHAELVTYEPVWSGLMARRADDSVAFIDGGTGKRITFRELAQRVELVSAGLRARGVAPGDRVAVLIPPSIDLVVVIYACWRAGAVTVVADRGLGLRGLGRAVRSARVQFAMGPGRALAAAAALRWCPGAVPIDVSTLPQLEAHSVGLALPDGPGADDPAAVLFTSGATGPAKGVRYNHGALAAQRDALRVAYNITSQDRLVAAFAPFALYGPALGIASATPDCDVTKPGSLMAAVLSDIVKALDATLAFGSPAALANVLATSKRTAPMPGLRLVMSAGAPVPAETLRALRPLAPNARFHTPYGMTEALPVSDIELADIEAAEQTGDETGGVCVGRAVPGAEIMIAPLLGAAGVPVRPIVAGTTGDILVRSPWLSSGYDRLFRTENDARPIDDAALVWHRTGDVGHLDVDGRLWVEGRSVHVIHTADGSVTPVPIERRVEKALDLSRSAAVGVGPLGCQQIIVVIEATGGDGLATTHQADRVRAATAQPIAAVLRRKALPVDIRHNAKIDRTAVAQWASDVLAGRSA